MRSAIRGKSGLGLGMRRGVNECPREPDFSLRWNKAACPLSSFPKKKILAVGGKLRAVCNGEYFLHYRTSFSSLQALF